MSSVIQWSLEAADYAIDSAQMDNLANDGLAKQLLTSFIPNYTNQYERMSFQCYIAGFDGAPASGGYLDFHICYDIGGLLCDGSDGTWDTGINMNENTRVGRFQLAPLNQAQYIQLRNIRVYPFHFLCALIHRGGVGSGLDEDNAVILVPHNLEAQ